MEGDGRISFTIQGNPKTKKNNMRPIKTKTGKVMLIQSQRYLDYESEALPQLAVIKQKLKITEPISQPINLQCIYYRSSHIRCDLVNLLNATADILVKAGIIADDNFNIVIGVDGSRVYIDKNNPRVEVKITEARR